MFDIFKRPFSSAQSTFATRALQDKKATINLTLKADDTPKKKMTLRDYLHALFDQVYLKDPAGNYMLNAAGEKRIGNRAMKNFLNEHDLVGTINGSPHWRRNQNYYTRH